MSGNKVINSTTAKLGIYEESNDSALSACLGQVKEMEDGRVFRLCKNGAAALVAGIIVQNPAQDAYDDALVVNTAASAGAKEIEVTVTASHGGYAENALKDGFLVVNQGSGDIGTFYKIKANDAMVAEASATITLYDGLTTALTATTNEVSISLAPFKDVVIGSTDGILVGVPIIAVTAAYYFWALTKGYGPATDSGSAISAGDVVSHVGGDVITQDGSEDASIGMAVTAAAANDALIVNYFGF